MVLHFDDAKLTSIFSAREFYCLCFFLKIRTEFNLELTVATKKTGFHLRKPYNSVLVLFQCYRFINRYFFEQRFYQGSGRDIIRFCLIIEQNPVI